MHILYSHALINPPQREKMLLLQIYPNSGQFLDGFSLSEYFFTF